jgi:hypothetical protein
MHVHRRLRTLTLWSDLAASEKRKLLSVGEALRVLHTAPATGNNRTKKTAVAEVILWSYSMQCNRNH